MVDNSDCETQDMIREGWATHFQHLVTPLENPRFDQTYKQIVDADVEIIEDLCKDKCFPIDPVTVAEEASALKRLNDNKADKK